MKIAVFIDYWNFQLTLNQKLSKENNVEDYRAKIDWRNLGQMLAAEGSSLLTAAQGGYAYEGCHIYTSFNPATDQGNKFKGWATTWLDRQPGINVQIRERRPKALPKCPSCHKEISHCPHDGCGKPIVATVEKGVDTLIVTDLVRMAKVTPMMPLSWPALMRIRFPLLNLSSHWVRRSFRLGFPQLV